MKNIYANTVLADTPLRYYRLGEGMNATAAPDLGSQAQNGTYGAGVTFGVASLLPGDTDTSITCPGNAAAVTLPLTGLPTGTAAWSMEAWLSPTSSDLDGSYHAIVGMGTNSYLEMAVMYTHSGGVIFSPSGNDTSSTNTQMVAGQPYHCVITWDGTTIRVYVNGALATSSTPTFNLVQGGARIGAAPTNNGDYFHGGVDEVAIYGYALSASRILLHYLVGKNVSGYAGVVLGDTPLAYYRLNDNVGAATAVDSAPHGRTGTVSGSVTFGATAILGDATEQAASFGTSSYVSIPMTGLPTGAAPWSIEAWVTIPVMPGSGSHHTILGFGSYANNSMASLQVYNNGSINQVLLSCYSVDIGSAAITTNTRYHVVGTYDGTTTRLYLNGAFVTSGTFTLTLGSAFASIGAGNSPAGDFLSSGAVSEAAIYAYTLSAQQVQTHYTAGIAIPVSVMIWGAGNALSRFNIQPPTLPFLPGVPTTSRAATSSIAAQAVVPAPLFTGRGASTSSRLTPLIYTWINGIAYVTLPVQPYTSFSPTTFLGIADNIAQALADIQKAFVANLQTTPPTLTTLRNGVTQLESRVAALADIQQEALLGPMATQSANALLNFLAVQPVAVTQIYKAIFNDLDLYAKGIAAYLQQNNLQVHPLFAQAFNYVAQYAPILQVRNSVITKISPQNVFVPTETTLGTYTGAGSYLAQPSLDTTQYGDAPLSLKNIGSVSIASGTTITITYTTWSGASQTFTYTFPTTLSLGATIAINIQGVACSNIVFSNGSSGSITVQTVTTTHALVSQTVSSVAPGTQLSIVAEPTRIINY